MKKYSLIVLLGLFTLSNVAQAADSKTGVKGYIDTIVSIPGDTLMHGLSSIFQATGDVISSFAKPWADASQGIQEAGNISK